MKRRAAHFGRKWKRRLNRIRDWIRQLELAREDEDAEPFDLMAIDEYLETARGCVESAGAEAATDTGSAR